MSVPVVCLKLTATCQLKAPQCSTQPPGSSHQCRATSSSQWQQQPPVDL